MNELTVVTDFEEVSKVAGAMVKSGYFQDAREVSQAIVKILAGAEMGIGAFQSMQSIYIIQGRPSMSANLMASKVKASRRYNYRIVQLDDTACDLEFFEDGKSAGHSVFTLKDAQKAGTKNLDKFPRNMLFSRAMSNGVRWYCPDVVGSAAVYTPEELGADVAEDGTVIDVKPTPVEKVIQAQEVKTPISHSAELPNMTYETASTAQSSDGRMYIEIESKPLSFMLNSIQKKLALPDLPPEEREVCQFKTDAIKVILAHRAQEGEK